MSAKAMFVVCAQALLVQLSLSQCIGRSPAAACGGSIWPGPALAAPSCGPAIQVAPTSGGALPVSSSSAIAPSGISVASENAFEGQLVVIGELPFLSAVALEGVLPSGGAGLVNHSCGNGITAISNEGWGSAAGIGSIAGIGSGAYGYGPTAAGWGGYGLGGAAIGTGAGCGCGGYGIY